MAWVQEWVVAVMRAIGAPGVGVATLLETVFPPVPSEVVLPLAGFTAAQGHYSFSAAVAWATAGSVAGALLLYWAGAAWGLDRLRALADRLPLVGHRDVDRSIEWFDRHGRTAVFVGRMVPGVRSLISIPAGVQRMRLAPFLGYTTAGSLVWNAGLIGAGHALGARWHVVERYVGGAANAVYVVLGAVVAFLVLRRVRRRRSRRAQPAGRSG
jgi:membrane protein DedA with SNARE-associated domain